MKRLNFFVRTLSFVAVFTLVITGVSIPTFAHADAASDAAVQAQIDAHNAQIQALDAEIAGYQAQLTTLGSQKTTLQTSIKSIDVTKAKTTAQIAATQNQIAAANLQLQQLGGLILTKQQQINLDKQAIALSLRNVAAADQQPLIVQLFSTDTLADAWAAVDEEDVVQQSLSTNSQTLSSDQEQLATQQSHVTDTKTQLSTYDKNLTTQKGQLVATEQSKTQLLAQTNSKESTYQTLIAQKKAQEAQFENELTTLQNSLKNVTAAQIPHTGQGILAWPFSDATMQSCVGKKSALGNIYCITQYFGNTPFATANAAIYSGMGHDGIDIGVPIGTPVQAALSGVVAGTGNTDLVHDAAGDQCYSFGMWIMIQHPNGLNTMYAHLSKISVTKGQAVTTGDVIGYSGMTGYATGPHLHFGVYATAGVQYLTLGQFHGTKTPCSGATMPVAPSDAYLNPLSYL